MHCHASVPLARQRLVASQRLLSGIGCRFGNQSSSETRRHRYLMQVERFEGTCRELFVNPRPFRQCPAQLAIVARGLDAPRALVMTGANLRRMR